MRSSRSWRRVSSLMTFTVVVTSLLGCGTPLKLRPDWDRPEANDDRGTTGGMWSERGLLDDEQMGAGRGLASGGPREPNAARSWVTDETQERYRRDLYRGRDVAGNWAEGGVPNYADNPNMPPQSRRQFKNGSRATRADFVDESNNEGSLWASDGQTNYYFTKNKVRGVGDIVAVNLEQALVSDVGAEIKRTLSEKEREMELELAQARLAGGAATERAPASGAPAAAANPAAADPTAPAEPGKEVRNATPADIDVLKSIELKAGDTVMAEIIERYPNGNYKIRGTKKVQYKVGGPRMVQLTAIARGADISEEDLIPSGKLYEYRLESFR